MFKSGPKSGSKPVRFPTVIRIWACFWTVFFRNLQISIFKSILFSAICHTHISGLFHLRIPPLFVPDRQQGGYSYVSAGRRPKILTIWEAKMQLKVYFCNVNRSFASEKLKIFRLRRADDINHSFSLILMNPIWAQNCTQEYPPCLSRIVNKGGGILKWNSPDSRDWY